MWAEWCRDPLLNLGCQDPVERVGALKANDPHRQRIGELFRTWWQHHGADIMKANCSTEATLTPTARLASMAQRLDTMLQALDTVQPALTRFYASLNDEQKARFNILGVPLPQRG